MNSFRRIVSIVLAAMLIVTCGIISVNAATVETEEVDATAGITVHYYGTSTTPNIYYWNSLPTNISSPAYPGPTMSKDSSASGSNCYKYTFSNVTKINFLIVENGKQSAEFTRESASSNDWWYKDGKWYKADPYQYDTYERTDLREDSIYFIITTRFYDGDTGNNIHCWDDAKANNPDSDPAWRGDFKGLIQKLDYIKALGFSAIWITPVVENCSGYDYHGYHAFDFAKVDPRYESSDTTYDDLIAAAHEKGLKIVQDVVWNHTSNFGEAVLAPMFTKDYSKLDSSDCLQLIKGSALDKAYPSYETMKPDPQYAARINVMKEDSYEPKHYYHHDKSLSYGSYTEQTGQMAGDCVDINTENPEVANYIVSTYMDYVNQGVDSFRFDTEKHINRWTLNSAYFPTFAAVDNFYIFGEVCARRREATNEGGQSDSCYFYSWKETDSAWQNNWSTTDWKSNYDNSVKHYGVYNNGTPSVTSKNAFLNGNEYHTPDYSQWNGTSTIDFTMHWNFYRAGDAYGAALSEDSFFNDSTWNVVYVDSHDYSPDDCQTVRYNAGTSAWAENMCLMFTFRGIPCIYYGSEVEFKAGQVIDVGPNAPLEETGRAYFGSYLEGNVSASDFGDYTASGTVKSTLESTLSKQLIKLNKIRRAVPALQKGQYASVGDMCFKRGYTDPDTGAKSFACVCVTNGATFSSVPNGTYIDAVTGDTKNVSNGTLTVSAPGTGNCRVYVLSSNGYKGISGKIGGTTQYLK